MSDSEKFEIAQESLYEIQKAVEYVKSEAYKHSEDSYPDKEKGAYYSGEYNAYSYVFQLLNNELHYLTKVKNFQKV